MHEVITKALNSPDVFRANWHPLGFIHVLPISEELLRFRVHIWPPKMSVQDARFLVHSHRFTINSYVIAGSIRNRPYTVEDSAQGTHRVYEVRYFENVSAMYPTDKTVDAIARASSDQHTGMNYLVQEGEFHESELLSQTGAVTLVEMSQHIESPPHVLGPIIPPKPVDLSYPRQDCPQEEWTKLLHEILNQS